MVYIYNIYTIGWVFLSMALGFGVGSFIFYPKMSIAEKHDK